MEDPVPQTLGHYQVVKLLATGGMAQVLLAHTQAAGTSEYHVIKRIRPDQGRDARFVSMFLDEARLAAQLRHPNIVRVFEIASQPGESWFSMEYIHGEDLRRVLMEVTRARDKVPIALITGIVAAIAEGLNYAHELVGYDRSPLGIVHRDVSPANILIGYDGTVKLADFGIAKAALRTVETRSGTLKGKVSYMSPEQVTGKPIDRRSDVFALGIVLYELATARRLFKGENDFLTMSAIVQGDIPLPSTQRPDLPRPLEDIIMRALSEDPDDRFQSAEELRAALEKFTHTLGMRMSPSSIADYMKKLFGSRVPPWLVVDEPTVTTSIDFDGELSGMVTVRDSAMPRVQASPSSPLVFARSGVTGRAATEPGDGWIDPTTFAWSREATRPGSRRRLGIVIAATAAATLLGVVILASTGDHDLGPTTAPPAAHLAAPAPAPDEAAPPTTTEEAAPVVAAPPEPPAPVVAPAPTEPAPGRVEATTSEPATGDAAKKLEKPRAVRKVIRRPRIDSRKNPAWDPNALFPK